jgi:hypothetical protein
MAYFIPQQTIKLAMRQLDRWMFASKQDRNAGVALLHANYAVGDVDMLRMAASDMEIKSATGRNALTLFHQAIALQDAAQEKIKGICPQLFN